MENTLYHGFQIQQNECGWFNVPTINCWAAQTIEAAKRAIDAHRNHVGLNENGVPLASHATRNWDPEAGDPSENPKL